DRQSYAGHYQSSADRNLGPASTGKVYLSVSRDSSSVRNRYLQREQFHFRRLHGCTFRYRWLHALQAWVRTGSADPRLYSRATDGRKYAPCTAVLAWGSYDVHRTANQPDPAVGGCSSPGHPCNARHQTETRTSLCRVESHKTTQRGRLLTQGADCGRDSSQLEDQVVG